MLHPALIEQYWDRVRGILQAAHQLDSQQSEQAIARYRQLVEPKAGDMVYHEDAGKVAETIAVAEKKGWPYSG